MAMGILLLLSALFILFFPWIKKAIQRYFRQKKYLPILNEINFLYQDVNPFELSLQARKQESFPSYLIYGETSLCAFLDLLEIVQPQKNETFYDLGSGCGKTLIAAKLRYPTLTVKGIEFLPVLHALAKDKAEYYRHRYRLSPHQWDITLICDNILNHALEDANIIFICATGYSTETWEPVLEKLLTVKPNTRIIITSKTLPEAAFILRYQGMERMSWGLTSTYIYEKMI